MTTTKQMLERTKEILDKVTRTIMTPQEASLVIQTAQTQALVVIAERLGEINENLERLVVRMP